MTHQTYDAPCSSPGIVRGVAHRNVSNKMRRFLPPNQSPGTLNPSHTGDPLGVINGPIRSGIPSYQRPLLPRREGRTYVPQYLPRAILSVFGLRNGGGIQYPFRKFGVYYYYGVDSVNNGAIQMDGF